MAPVEKKRQTTVQVEESGEGKFTNTIRSGRHQTFADEPAGAGGQDRGPTPYELLLSALGACTSITLRMYADRKGWPLEHVSVDLRHEKIHADDCAQCDTEKGYVDRIHIEIDLRGPLDVEQRARLLDIAHKCPVHRTLQNEIDMPTSLTEGVST
jgi:putative redox protein